jgi:outer membrane protein assembly factor BamB
MKWVVVACLAACGDNSTLPPESHCDGWRQWGNDDGHTGRSCAAGQPLERVLADIVLDPMTPMEEYDAGGELTIHYQVPLIDGDAVYVMEKRGTYTPCEKKFQMGVLLPDCNEPDELFRLNSEIWTEVRYHWEGGALVGDWSFESDWTPEPEVGFEPMFQPALAGDTIAIPGANGSLWLLAASTGKVVHHVEVAGFGPAVYVAGPITERGGTFYYNALTVDPTQPYAAPSRAWLVAVAPDGTASTADYATLVPGAPAPGDGCYLSFDPDKTPFPWPPPPNPDGTPVLPPAGYCGSQLPGINSAPTFAHDGALYVVTHAQYNERYSYLVSIDPGTWRANWASSLRDRLDDGCGVTEYCPDGAMPGVDASTNLPPAAAVDDESSSNPVVMDDGTVLYGAFTGYNGVRGHLLAFAPEGRFRGSYDFGWDTTPAVAGDRIVLKDNNYIDMQDPSIEEPGPYYVTALDTSLQPVWQFQNTETKSCIHAPDGTVKCVSDHPHGFEWCVNAPAIDRDGTIFANSEDGNLYAITSYGVLRDRFFLDRSLGAAYTPVALDHTGRIYALNNGHLIVVGAN